MAGVAVVFRSQSTCRKKFTVQMVAKNWASGNSAMVDVAKRTLKITGLPLVMWIQV
jgi:hypothetical protein